MSDSESEAKPALFLRHNAETLRANVTTDEKEFRLLQYPDEEAFLKQKKVECTACGKDIRQSIIRRHSIEVNECLDVLICRDCKEFYSNGKFTIDEDGSDEFCRWCGQGGNLYCCSYCSVAICAKCIKRNLPKTYKKEVEEDDWKCFICVPKPIWSYRALCHAAKKYMAKYKSAKVKRVIEESTENEIDDGTPSPPRRSKRPKREVSSGDSDKETEDSEKDTRKIRKHERKSKKAEDSELEESDRETRRTRKRDRKSNRILNSDGEDIEEVKMTRRNARKSRSTRDSDKETDESQDRDKNVKKSQANSSKRGDIISSGDEYGRSNKLNKIEKRTSLSPTKEKSKLLEGVVNSILKDYEKLTKIMVRTKSEFANRYTKNKKYFEDFKKSEIMKEKLLTLLRDSKESVENLEHTFLEGWKSVEYYNKNAGEPAVNGDAKNDDNKVDSSDDTVLMNSQEIENVSQPDELEKDEADESVSNSFTKAICASSIEESVTETAADNSNIDEKSSEMEVDDQGKEIFEYAIAAENTFEKSKDDVLVSSSGCSKWDNPESPEFMDVSNNVIAKVSPDDNKNCNLTFENPEDKDSSSENKSENSDLQNSGVKGNESSMEFAAKKSLLGESVTTSSENEDENGKIDSDCNLSGIEALKSDADEIEAKTKNKSKLRKGVGCKKSFSNITSSEDEEKKEDREIKRLTNLTNLARKRVKISPENENKNESDAGGGEEKANTSKIGSEKRKLSFKKKEIGLVDYLSSNSGTTNEESEECSFELFNSTMNEKKKKFSCKEEIAKEFLLTSTDEDNVPRSGHESLNEKKANSAKNKRRNTYKSKGKTRSVTELDLTEDEDKREKSRWRNDPLLKRTSLEIDSSDSEEERVAARATMRKLREQKNQSVESSDSEGIFRVNSKAGLIKRKSRPKLKSSDSDSFEIVESCLSSTQSSSDNSTKKKKKIKRRKRIRNLADSNSSDEDKKKNGSEPGSASKGRKNIRKVLKDEDIAEQTRRTTKEEESRKKRIAERQALFNATFNTPDISEKVPVKLVLDFDPDTKEEIVSVHPKLLKKLKPHQAHGVKFMWDACFESLKEIEKGKGGGCILAHCMGLGKTLQVITLVHTLLAHEATKVKTVLVICPLSTVLNWYAEFEMWLKDMEDYDYINLSELTKAKNNRARADYLRFWFQHGGVMILGYEMFRSVVNAGNISEKLKRDIKRALLDPGPDLVICDEGHILKNEKSAISKATMQINSLRRIVLTGTPLQNNLVEYHCMVQFVKPNLLGDRKEFVNRFVNPITNGQYFDSSEKDVRLMKRRAHVLHRMLDGIVQRFDYKVLTPFLPPKHEFVISVALSDLQAKLYEHYIQTRSLVTCGNSTLFKDYQIMRLIWTHPLAMKLSAQNRQRLLDKEESDDSMREFIVNNSGNSESDAYSKDSSDSVISVSSNDSKKKTNGRLTRAKRKELGTELEDVEEDLVINQWWQEFVTSADIEDHKQGPKLILLFAILRQCELMGDKVLVFSQSIPSLDMIEYFLQKTEDFSQRLPENSIMEEPADYIGSWEKNADYFRLDGQTPNELRSRYCKHFNNTENTRARLFLISTKAGGLGINLTAANRVIIFDASWNPSYDIQSIFRVYRFGQTKPCYIYRFLSQGTMEEKIYERQVTKLSVSCRVVDEQQIDRHFSRNEVAELYTFNRKPPMDEIPKFPSDRLMAELLKQYRDAILSYHEHDSLLENIQEEELTEEERKQAWNDYEEEKNLVYLPPTQIKTANAGIVSDKNNRIDDDRILNALREEHPHINEFQLNNMKMMVRQKLAEYYAQPRQHGKPLAKPATIITRPATEQEAQDQIELKKTAMMHQLRAQAEQKALAQLSAMSGGNVPSVSGVSTVLSAFQNR